MADNVQIGNLIIEAHHTILKATIMQRPTAEELRADVPTGPSKSVIAAAIGEAYDKIISDANVLLQQAIDRGDNATMESLNLQMDKCTNLRDTMLGNLAREEE